MVLLNGHEALIKPSSYVSRQQLWRFFIRILLPFLMRMIIRFLIKYYFRHHDDLSVHVGTKLQPGTLIVNIPPIDLWEKETLSKKIKSFLTWDYRPTPDLLQQSVENTLTADIVGGMEDFEKAKAASIMTFSTRTRFRGLHYNVMHLQLVNRAPDMLTLLAPIAIKIPILAVRYYLDIHYEFAFNSIRKSEHPKSDALIGYLYEVSLLQQKTAMALHEFIRKVVSSADKKQETLLTRSEVDAVSQAELAITYLKSSIEKMVNLVALTFSIET